MMRIIFLGSQGSGKSTQAQLAAQKLKVPWIEMGQLLRDRAQAADSEAIEIEQALNTGALVRDQITIKSLRERLQHRDCKNGYVIDGYPRNYAQLEGLPHPIDKVFYVKVSDQEGIRRSINRARSDDTLKVLTTRLKLYHQMTEPLLTYFRQKGILQEVDGERTIEAIEKDVAKILDNELKKTSS